MFVYVVCTVCLLQSLIYVFCPMSTQLRLQLYLDSELTNGSMAAVAATAAAAAYLCCNEMIL